MLTVNIDIADRLINGQIRTVKHISYNNINGHIVKVYIKFDDAQAGLKKIDTDPFGKQHQWVPIEKKLKQVL